MVLPIVPKRPVKVASAVKTEHTAKAARPIGRRTAANPAAGRTMDEAKRLHDASGEEFFGAQLFTPDTQRDMPFAMQHEDLSASVGANKWALADAHSAFTLTGNRGGFAMSQRPDIGVQQFAMSGFKNIGAAGAGASYAVHSDEVQTVRLGLDAFGAQNLAGIAPSLSWADGKGARMGVGVGLFGATNFSIRLVETYDDPEAPGGGKALVEVRREATPGIAFDPSPAVNAVGMGAKICICGGQQTVYRTVMDQRELGDVLRRTQVNRQGLRGLVARFGAATGVATAPVAIPDVHDPLNKLGNNKALQVGEQITNTLGDSKTVGAAPGMWGLRVGIFYHHNEAIACTVERLDDSRVKVTIAPRELRAVSLGLDALLVADARREISHSKALCHSAVFDLEHPEAWQAYRTLMDKPDAFDADTLSAVSGVKILAHESTESSMQRDGAGIPRPPLFSHLKIAGMGRHGVELKQEHVLRHDDMTYKTRRLLRGTQTHRLWDGEAQTRIDTQLHTRQNKGDAQPEFMGVSLTLVFEYDRMTEADAGRLHALLQDISGEAIAAARPHERGHDYKVSVNRVLSRDDFAALARHNDAAVAQAAARAGADGAKLADIIDGIQSHLDDIHAPGNALCEQLAEADVPIWTALCHLAPQNAVAKIGIHSERFADVTTRVREFLLKDAATPPGPSHTALGLATIVRLRRELDRALSQLENDTLLEHYDAPARQKHIAALVWSKTALEEAAQARKARATLVPLRLKPTPA